MTVPCALTIAGSDSGGGAGIQADLKTFSALQTYGCSVITALTAQNTQGVQGVSTVEPAFVRQQMDSVFADIRIDATKLGMLATADIIAAVADGLRAWRPRHLVLDPVMVAKGGHRLLADDAVAALRRDLLPLATIITPNLPEAAVLLGRPEIKVRADMVGVAAALLDLGAKAVLLKGGHLDAPDSPDLLLDRDGERWLESPRIDTPHTHGTGCSYAAAVTAHLAHGRSLVDAVIAAKAWLADAIVAGAQLGIGRGRGPVHHFHALWRPSPDVPTA